ncbi:BREX-1 system adenine-specific DNA-methyltransferase PglX [Niallia sp. Krafla_26]|uniref:BREX-1 system adenine-specific DNA-methyltransferase PglX n=1 Tax=Niallia sp. Krafla_26 TaxID=3064703 RepID=UPI003D177084
MNKTELKNFAVSARRGLLEKVALRAKIFGIDENNGLTIEEKFGQLAINGEQYSLDKKSAFLALKKQLEIKSYEQLIEEVAYTWFNRIIAIRFMEVNEYMPERVNVLSSSTGKVEPDILSEFETMDLDIDLAAIKDLIRQGETEEAYRKLFIAQCNALNNILPFMFEKIHDYTELLLPDFLLDTESVINNLVSNEELTDSFREVEVIGWLYQFYNSEPKDIVFANLKKNKKIEKYDIPAATQLFTPKWIVQYMVENSLGKIWLESNPNSSLKESMRYYIEPAEQNKEVKQKLEEIRYKNVNLEEITIIDPCVGSGHILVYAFDLLYQMYEEAGYSSTDIPQLILENNLFGLDIDDRAAQLASFAILMKAREKSRRIFRKKVSINIYSIQESNLFEKEGIVELLGKNDTEKTEVKQILDTFIDAKNFGAILQLPQVNYDRYLNRIEQIEDTQLSLENFRIYDQMPTFQYLLRQAKVLSSKYDVTITNPPYMGNKGMNNVLTKFVKSKYPNSKGDLSTILMERSLNLTKSNGYISMINIPAWMFLVRYESLRDYLLSNTQIQNLVHFGRGVFGSDFGTVAFVLRNSHVSNYLATYKRLIDKQGEVESVAEKERKFFESRRNIIRKQEDFKLIPGTPISYWISNQLITVFSTGTPLSEIGEARSGLQTGNNDLFLRYWYEVDFKNIGFNFNSVEEASETNYKWFPQVKGGAFRKWYGNFDYVVNFLNNGEAIRNYEGTGIIKSPHLYFKEGITWSHTSNLSFGCRILPKGFIFNVEAPTVFNIDDNLLLLGLLNTKLTDFIFSLINQSFHYLVGDMKKLPIILPKDKEEISNIRRIVEENILISKIDWDSSEFSWNFKKHFILLNKNNFYTIEQSYNNWCEIVNRQFINMKKNEETLNAIFINLYGMNEEMNPYVADEAITLNKSDRKTDIKSFLSYFIGNLMGRYSLDIDGIVYAGGSWDDSKYKAFIPNKFGLIQLSDEHYFENDIIARLREFLSVTFGEETVEENLQWLAESLELKRNETAEERLRRYFMDEFYKDHCQLYQKRPIYWLVDSGKQKGLRTLIYMHRYQPDTMATIRFEHLQEIQEKYNNEIAAIDLRIVNPNLSATEKRDLEKRKTAFQKRLDELLDFDKKLAEYANAQIDIDLDDGVKVNYAKFDKVLAKIK